LEPRPFEPVFVRPGLSAFSHQRLKEFAEAERGGELILVALTIGPACLATAFDAHDLGLRVILAEDTLAASAFGPFASATVRGVLLRAAGPFVRRTTTLELFQQTGSTGQPAAANDIIGETELRER
jgi:nicotinamidase-related amidase